MQYSCIKKFKWSCAVIHNAMFFYNTSVHVTMQHIGLPHNINFSPLTIYYSLFRIATDTIYQVVFVEFTLAHVGGGYST